MVATLYILGVHDLRCYAFAALSLPVVAGVQLGNLTLLLVPPRGWGMALAGAKVRVRRSVGHRNRHEAVLVAASLLADRTRRYGAAATSVTVAIAAIVMSWAVIGFDGLRPIPIYWPLQMTSMQRIATRWQLSWAGSGYPRTTQAEWRCRSAWHSASWPS